MMEDAELKRLVDLAQHIVDLAKKRGADVAEATARSGSELSAKVRMGEPELVEEAGSRALGLRVMKGQRVAMTSTSDLSEEGLNRFVQDAMELLELSQEDPFAGPAEASQLAKPPFADLQTYDPAGGAIDAKEAVQRAQRAEKAALEFDKRISNSEGGTFSRTAGGSALVLSSGFVGASKGSYQSVVVVPVADDEGGRKRRGHYWSARRFLAELESEADVGQEAARRTLAKLGARKVATCEAPVVFDSDAGRSILGLVASVIMGRGIWRKSSYLVDRENTQVASNLVTVVDDPLIPRAPGSRVFDGEGLPSRTNVVIENGILRTYLCGCYSARKLKRESTGNASRGSSGGIGESTTNFVLQPGTSSRDDILAATKSGLYVTDMMGFGFNAVTGDFSRGASGFWIEDGKLSYPVNEVTISLNLDEMLKRIDMVGSDLDMRSSIATPTFRISSMTISGQ
jgi:PmbA protein